MAKNIVFCADGTWNNAGQDAKNDDATNVLKLYQLLAGDIVGGSEFLRGDPPEIVEGEKVLKAADGSTLQVAKYINGVGNSANIIKKLFSGAFGAGVVQRIVRGYTYISRNYQPGDHIFIIGFSRGAYTARALAGMIATQGLLKTSFKSGSQESYQAATDAWFYYRNTVKVKDEDLLADLMTAVLNKGLWSLVKSVFNPHLSSDDFIAVDHIASVAVWDTVGAMGIPKFNIQNKELVDAFRFADEVLSKKVRLGLHAIALDEKRELFKPTLWNAGGNVLQRVFIGGHADVGGGYTEKGLSDIALEWMVTQLTQAPLLIGSPALFAPNYNTKLQPNFKAPAHQELHNLAKYIRQFKPSSQIEAHASIKQRKGAGNVVHRRDDEHNKDYDVRPYDPTNWPPV